MENNKALFTVLGWEQRFLLSLNHIIENNKINIIHLICFKDYMHMIDMHVNLKSVRDLIKENKIELNIIELEYENSISNWKKMNEFFYSTRFQDVILNITTFPRETIWTLLFFLRKSLPSVTYIYYKPESYDKSEGGLTKNHKSPRLLFKHSGVFDLDKKLVLFIITGFDYNRRDLLIEHFEPFKVVYLFQKGDQFENIDRNCGFSNRTEFKNTVFDNIEIDCYDIDGTFDTLSYLIGIHNDYNIIITSQGPKTSAISTYRAFLNNNNIALAYVPAREFSGVYSSGFDLNFIYGNISLK